MSEAPTPRPKDDEPRIHPTADLKNCRLGRAAEVKERVILRDVSLGDFSYIERHAEAMHADIGKFCSIAANTRINAVEHPVERLTTHKVSYRPNEYFIHLGVDDGFRERRRVKRVTIGHDVWIGHGAVIMPGVTIRNGAVIGANAVVTKAVGAYEIHAGVPSRKLRPRFAPEIAMRIERLAWWDWPAEKLAAAIPDIQRLDIEAFLERWEAA